MSVPISACGDGLELWPGLTELRKVDSAPSVSKKRALSHERSTVSSGDRERMGTMSPYQAHRVGNILHWNESRLDRRGRSCQRTAVAVATVTPVCGSFRSARRVRLAGLVVAAVVFLTGCEVSPPAVIPSESVGSFRLAEAETSKFHINVAPHLRNRIPDRDSSLRRYAPYPD